MNNKVFEPEFRIVLVLFQLIGAAVGLFPFGYSVDQHWSYYISILLFAFVTFALIMGATATGTYIVDAHLDMAVEAFLCITLFKNFVSFGMTLHVFDILLSVGNTKVPPSLPRVPSRGCLGVVCFDLLFDVLILMVDVLYPWRGTSGSLSFECTDVRVWEIFSELFRKT